MTVREEIARLAQDSLVTAGAGAGKTTALVQTYLTLLAGSPEREPRAPGQIVAITFTEKAAAEMRARIVSRVADLARSSPAEGRFWQALAPQVEWAPIATIHSFCASLLREYGVLVGLDPDFAVLDQDAFQEVLDTVAVELIGEKLAAKDVAFGDLLQHLSLGGAGYDLISLLEGLYQSLATLGLASEQARAATAAAHQKALDQAPAWGSKLQAAVSDLAAAYGELCGAPPAKQPKFVAKLAELLALWPRAQTRLAGDPLDQAALEALRPWLGGNWGKNVNPLRRAAVEAVDQLLALAALPPAARLSDGLLALAAEYGVRVERELGRRAGVSFDGLLLHTQALLQDHPAVRSELRRRWRVLMVDEYQDVNPVQGRLVALLAGAAEEGGEAATEPPPRLLLVGDRKQSIYAFRGADVSVYNQARDDFAEGRGRLLALPENFRSRPALVGFFNRLFPQVFAGGEGRQLLPRVYVDFLPEDEQTPANPGAEPTYPAVEVLDAAAWGHADTSLAAWRVHEARCLARHLAGLLERDEAQPGEMAVLFRRLSNVKVFEEAFREAGIEFYTVRGKGFYACQEVTDLSNALLAALDPGHEPALAAFLRSPLVGLSDETLLALVHGAPGEPASLGRAFWEGRGLPAWVAPEQAARLATARRILGRLAPLARRLTAAELVTRLVEETWADPLLQGLPGGRQMAANLRKLIEKARDPGSLLSGGAEAFAQGLAGLAAHPPEDPQAPLAAEKSPVVRFMTIHQAKGLEFPVVALADLAGQRPGGATLLAGPDARGVICLAPWDPARGIRPKPGLAQELKALAKAREEAEEARLFYVAATRAETRLIFCLNGATRQTAWAKWVRELVQDDPACHLLQPGREEAPAALPRTAVAAAWPAGIPPEPGPRDAAGRALVARCLNPAPVPVSLVRESVSGLENWFTCPRLYLHTRRLGLDTGQMLAGEEAPARPGGVSAVDLGLMVHRLLEETDLAAGPAGLAPALAAWPEALDLDPALAEALKSLAAQLWDTPLAADLAGAPERGVWREQPFLLRLAGPAGQPALELRGEFDLLVIDPAGRLLLVDYKVSEHFTPERYRTQLLLYGLALWRGQGGGAGGQAPLPRAGLVFLGSQGPRWQELDFTAAELVELEQRLVEAAAGIAALGGESDPAALPPGPKCRREGCLLAGFCPPPGGNP
ncbi:MAG: UvrD-helicase domain-containing protein [Deltaproteobacteria bacterium]|nr:UvrD-helicase domain-containing protein [Deltaproteobacteria bacterium]